jgi:hypothetical protein
MKCKSPAGQPTDGLRRSRATPPRQRHPTATITALMYAATLRDPGGCTG